MGFVTRVWQNLITTGYLIHFVKVIIMLSDVLTDIISGAKLIRWSQTGQKNTKGLICGITILAVLLLPGLAYGIVRNKGRRIPILMFTFQFHLVTSGVRSIFLNSLYSSYVYNRKRFLMLKKYESLMEGGMQAVITLYVIMLIPGYTNWITSVSVVFSLLSVFWGCIEKVSEDQFISGHKVFWPGKVMAAVSVPDSLVVAVMYYPTYKSIIDFLFIHGHSSEVVLGATICLHGLIILLGLCSLSRIYMIFLKDVRYKLAENRQSLGEQNPRTNNVKDLFWNINSDRMKKIFLIFTIFSDIVLLCLNAAATFCVYSYDSNNNNRFRFILKACCLFRTITTIIDVLYLHKPHIFIKIMDDIDAKVIKIKNAIQILHDRIETNQREREAIVARLANRIKDVHHPNVTDLNDMTTISSKVKQLIETLYCVSEATEDNFDENYHNTNILDTFFIKLEYSSKDNDNHVNHVHYLLKRLETMIDKSNDVFFLINKRNNRRDQYDV